MKRIVLAAGVLFSVAVVASPSGHKWFPARIPVQYRVFNHTSINGVSNFGTNVLPRVQEAFLAWTSTRVACTSWRTNYTGTFTSPTGSAAANGNDMINNVIWLGGSQWRYSNSTLGLTTTLYYSNSGEIVDADMEMNDNITWANNGSFNAFDYESVVLHEAGHFLGLDHTPSVTAAVMYPTVANGQVKRTLATADINDVCGVYPGSGMGSQGNPCTSQSQCTGGLVCRSKSGSTGGKICTVDCTSNMNACSTVMPLTCQAADTGMACLPPATSADYCKFCLSGAECSSGNCIGDGIGHTWCTSPCSAQSPCPTGSECVDLNTAGSCTGTGTCICAPVSGGLTGSCSPTSPCPSGSICVNTMTGQQCTGGTCACWGGLRCPGQCTGTTCGTTPGFGCAGGTCQTLTGEGDRCELHVSCDACMICIGTQAAANCRRCCGGNGMGGECNACPNTACTGMNACIGLMGSNDRICYPQGGADLCQPCGGTTVCLNGNTCIGGSCHASCNPQSPGTCPACQAQTATTGFCACPGEERSEGQSCGGSGIAPCRTGLVCASGTCRRGCVLGDNSTCNTGETCSNVGGAAVCVTGAQGGTCAPCNNNNCAPGNTCYQGRCYTTCNVNVKPGPCDYSCVDVGGGVNICACDDQIRGSGQSCGTNPIAACGDRLLCINGVCTGECNPNTMPSTCPILTECKLLAGTQFTFVCQPIDNTGTGGGGGGNNLDCTPAGSVCPDGTECVPNGDGTATCKSNVTCDPNAAVSQCAPGKVCRTDLNGRFTCLPPGGGNDFGCGCSSGPGALVLLAAALLGRLRRRR